MELNQTRQLQRRLYLAHLLSGSIMELEVSVLGDGHGPNQMELIPIMILEIASAQMVSPIRLIHLPLVSESLSLHIMETTQQLEIISGI